MPSRSKSATIPANAEGPTFEQSLQELEEIIAVLDGGPQGLDELVEKYERGMGLLKQCQVQLEAAQLRIEQISRRADGGADSSPFPAENPASARPASAASSPPPASAPSDEIRLF